MPRLGRNSQHEVTAQGEAHEVQRLAPEQLLQAVNRADHFGETARMKQLAIEVVGVAVITQIQAHYFEAALEELLAEGQNVEGFRATFPTVQQHRDPAGALGRTGMETLQANAIPAVQEDRLRGRYDRRRPARDRTPTGVRAREHGLQVLVAEPPGWRKVVAVDDHGEDIPGRSAHPYLDAIIGSGCVVPFASGEVAPLRGILRGKDRGIPHRRLHLECSVRRMANVAGEIGESERGMLRG
jgi:hypothetical protein